MITVNPSTLDWRTQVNIFQAIKRAAQAIDSADAENAENAENINEIRAVQLGSHACTGSPSMSHENAE